MSTPPIIQDEPRSRITPGVQLLAGLVVAMQFLHWVVMDLRPLLALPASGMVHGWWRIATFPFVHANVGLMLVTVAALLLYGVPLERAWGQRKLTWFAFWCMLGAVLVAVIAAPSSTLSGGTAAAFGLLYAARRTGVGAAFGTATAASSNMLAATIVVLGIAWGVFDADAGSYDLSHLAHLAGFAFAALYMRTPPGMGVERLHTHVAPVEDVPDAPPRAVPRSQPRTRERLSETDEIVARSKAMTERRAATPRRRRSTDTGRPVALDEVLDKISAEGLESLSSAEREVLEEYARRLRGEE